MSKKGFFFTFIVFLLLIVIFEINSGISKINAQQIENSTEETAFKTVSNSFENIYNEIFTVKTGYPGRLQARILTLFNYSSGNIACSEAADAICSCSESPDGCGWIEITQQLPKQSTRLGTLFDALNLFEIFITDSRISDDLNITADAVKNAEWGSNDECKYVIMPQCIKYNERESEGEYILSFDKGTTADGCSQNFDEASINRIELTITIPGADVRIKDAPRCSGELSSGGNNCAKTAYTGKQEGHYYASIRIIVPECQTEGNCGHECCIENSDETFSEYADYSNSTSNYIELKGDSGWGNAGVFYVMDVGNDYVTSIRNPSGMDYQISTKLVFNAPIQEMQLTAFDFNIAKPNFDDLKIGTG